MIDRPMARHRAANAVISSLPQKAVDHGSTLPPPFVWVGSIHDRRADGPSPCGERGDSKPTAKGSRSWIDSTPLTVGSIHDRPADGPSPCGERGDFKSTAKGSRSWIDSTPLTVGSIHDRPADGPSPCGERGDVRPATKGSRSWIDSTAPPPFGWGRSMIDRPMGRHRAAKAVISHPPRKAVDHGSTLPPLTVGSIHDRPADGPSSCGERGDFKSAAKGSRSWIDSTPLRSGNDGRWPSAAYHPTCPANHSAYGVFFARNRL